MRFKWLTQRKNVRCVVALALASTITGTSLGQFRDLSAPHAEADTHLELTDQPFLRPATAGTETTAAKVDLPESAARLPAAANQSVQKDNASGGSSELIADDPTTKASAALQSIVKPRANSAVIDSAQPSRAKSANATATEPAPASAPTVATTAQPPAQPEPSRDLAQPHSLTEFSSIPPSIVASESQAASAKKSKVARTIHAASFNDVVPGTTNVADLKQQWGEPLDVLDTDSESTWVYRIPTFQQVDVTVNDQQTVTAIVVHLDTPLSIVHVSQKLQLASYRPVLIPDEFGDVLGQAYPERGVLLSFTEDIANLRVARIVLEPVSAELFRLRAQYDFDHNYEYDLLDVQQALVLNPQDSVAHWLQAELFDSIGRVDDAYQSITRAVKLEPTDPMYLLTRARLDAKLGRLVEGVNETKAIIEQMTMSDAVSARAHLQLGDLLGMGPKPDYQDSMQHHLKAVEFANGVIDDRRFTTRRMAKRVLVDAHLSISRDIALGSFQRQQEVVPKWLLRATELADELISQDRGDDLLRMHIFRTTLANYAELDGDFDAALASEEALKDGKRLIANASDTLYQQQVERQLAETMYHASKIERTRGRYESAMRFANNAVALLENTTDGLQQSEHDRYFQGQLYFLLGSLYAVQSENHADAVQWFDKALPLLASSAVSPMFLLHDQGESHVSMGVSYWEIGQHEKAVQLTEKGALQMKRAVEQGTLQLAALAVPYGNLAAMHEKLGNADKSTKYDEIATRIESGTKSVVR